MNEQAGRVTAGQIAAGFGLLAVIGAVLTALLSFSNWGWFDPSQGWRMAMTFLLPVGVLGVLATWAVGRTQEPSTWMRAGVLLALVAAAAFVVMLFVGY